MYRSTINLLKMLSALFILGFTSFTLAAGNGEYIRISEYLSLYPEQKNKIESFSSVVRNPAKPLKKSLKNPVKIAVIYPAEQSSDYWLRSVSTLEARLKELNITYQLNTFYSRPSVDIELQSTQLRDALQWQPDYLIFTLDATRHQAMIERILLKGKPRLILQNITTPLSRWQSLRPFLYTGFDHETGTLKLANAMSAHNPEGKYAMLYFSPGYVSKMRGNTFATHMEKVSSQEKVKSFYTQGDKDLAYRATLKTLAEHDELNMVFACSTDIALGAAQALREKGKHQQVLLNGWGGGDAEIDSLAKGEIDLTVMRMNDDSSIAMAEAIRLDQQGKAEEVPHVYSGDMVLIDQNTSKEELNSLKLRAFRYSGVSEN